MGRTAGDDLEEYYWGTQGVTTGSAINQLGIQERQRRQQTSSNGLGNSPATTPAASGPLADSEFERRIALLLGYAGGIAVGYFTYTRLTLEWYWPAGFGLATTALVSWAFRGPLRSVTVALRWLVKLATFATGIAALLFVLNAMGVFDSEPSAQRSVATSAQHGH